MRVHDAVAFKYFKNMFLNIKVKFFSYKSFTISLTLENHDSILIES